VRPSFVKLSPLFIPAPMPRKVNNVLGDTATLTQSSYRIAMAGIIRSIQSRHGESDRDTADRLGVSAATIGNARNEKGDLSPVTLLRIGKEYGLDAIAPALHLVGARAVPEGASCTTDATMPVPVAKAQVFLCEALADNGQIDDHEILADGAPEAIEQAGQVFDTLRWRLNGLRAKGRRG